MIRCNMCGKKIIGRKDFLHIQKNWGYFSHKDLERYEFNICEGCYDKIIKQFVIPPTILDIDVLGKVV